MSSYICHLQMSMNARYFPVCVLMESAGTPLGASGVAVMAASPLTWRNATVQVRLYLTRLVVDRTYLYRNVCDAIS